MSARDVPLLAKQGTARRRRLSPVGRTWMNGLYKQDMKIPEPIITAVIYFDQAPSLETLTKQFDEKIWPLDRFSSRVENNCFVPLEGPMDRAYHFREHEVANEAEIDAFAQSVMQTALPRSHPLWTCSVLRAKQGRSAIVLRIHHVISDGLGLLFAFLPLMKCDDGDVLSKIPLPAVMLGRQAAKPRPVAASPDRQQKRRGGPLAWFGSWFQFISVFFRGVFSILAMKEDSQLRCNAPLADRRPFLEYSGQRTFVRMPPVPTTAIKAVRVSQGCTFNDAIMAALAGALRRYLREDREDPLTEGTECKAFMLLGLPRPVDLNNASVSLANNILTPVFKLPIGEAEPRGRMRRTAAMCNDLKSTAYIMGIKLTTSLLTRILPAGLMQAITSEAVSKCTANITNLPLPEVPVTFCGAEMKEIQCIFVNPIPQISMLSYNGYLHWNIVADPKILPNASALGKYMLQEVDELAKA